MQENAHKYPVELSKGSNAKYTHYTPANDFAPPAASEKVADSIARCTTDSLEIIPDTFSVEVPNTRGVAVSDFLPGLQAAVASPLPPPCESKSNSNATLDAGGVHTLCCEGVATPGRGGGRACEFCARVCACVNLMGGG